MNLQNWLFIGIVVIQFGFIVILFITTKKISRMANINDNLEKLQELTYSSSLAQLYIQAIAFYKNHERTMSLVSNKSKMWYFPDNEYIKAINTIQDFINSYPEYEKKNFNKLNKSLIELYKKKIPTEE